MRGRGFLLWRRFGALWALPAFAVQAVVKGANPVIRAGEAEFFADEILGVVEELAVQKPGKVFGRFWPHPCLGLAVVASQALVVLAPGAPAELFAKGEP